MPPVNEDRVLLNLTLDSVSWVAACAKMIASLACIQLVKEESCTSTLETNSRVWFQIQGNFRSCRKMESSCPRTGESLHMLLSYTGT